MTEADQPWTTTGDDGSSTGRRAALVAGAAVATVVLATVGAVSGWVLAGGSGDDSAGLPTATDTGSTWPAAPTRTGGEPTPAVSRTSPRKKTAPPAGQLVVPDLVGLDFAEAREELRRRDLGWRLVFRGTGGGRAVEGTDPPADQTVRAGVTVRVMVAGAAPPASVPDVIGDPCSKAASRLVDEGLYPDYPGGRAGQVLRQEPDPGTELRWNDRVRIYCGKPRVGESSPAEAESD